MRAVRVIATGTYATRELADEAFRLRNEANRAKQQEEGCLQYELFRSGDDPCKLVLIELWASKALYDRYWTTQCEREGLPSPERLRQARIEFYEHAEYTVIDGVWQPVDESDRMTTIRWA